MGLTRAQFESLLVIRCGAALTRVGLDGSTKTGNNATLADPIRTAIRSLGYSVADAINPTDADLANVPPTRYELLYDQAERRALETVLGNCTDVDEKWGDDEQKLSQFTTQIEKRVAALTARIARSPGITSSGAVMKSIEAGSTAPGRLLAGDPRRWPPR